MLVISINTMVIPYENKYVEKKLQKTCIFQKRSVVLRSLTTSTLTLS